MKDDIATMPAGREMDAAIAEKVMGWKMPTSEAPRYSTDIAAAWHVVKHLGQQSDISVTVTQEGGAYSCQIRGPSGEWWARASGEGETAPLAICRGALALTLAADR
jgi:hypothetical protein